MRWVVVLLVVAALGAGYGLGVLSKSDSGGAAGRVERERGDAPAQKPHVQTILAAESGEDVSVPDLPKGDGIITGSVVDGSGKPLAGVLVVAQPVKDWKPRKMTKAPAGPVQQEIGELVREWASAEMWRRRGAKRATTDEDGQYALTSLGTVAYSLAAYKRGSQFRARTRRSVYNVRAPAEVHFVGSTVVRVPVDVVMADGSRPEYTQISIMQDMAGGGRSGTGDTWTADEPWIELAPGTYDLYAYPPGIQPRRPEQTRVVVPAEGTPPRVTLKIVIKPSLRVSVVPPPGFAPVRVQPRIVRIHGERMPELAELLESQDITAWPESEYTFRFRGLDAGKYLIGAGTSHSSPIVVSKVVDARAGTTDVVLHLPAPEPTAHFMVRPTDPNGGPVGELQWTVQMRSERRRSSRGGGAAMRRDDGVFFVPVPTEHADPEADHFVTAQSRDWGKLKVKVALGSTEIVQMVFDKPGFVEATIAGYVGSGREGRLSLTLIPQEGDARRNSSASEKKPDEQGVVRLGPVQPGSYEIRMSLRSSRHRSFAVAKQLVAVGSGAQKASIAIPVLHQLKVIWNGDGRPRLSIQPMEGDMRWASIEAQVGEDGVALFRDLAAGEYRVRVPGKSRRASPTVSVPETKQLRLP